MSGSRTGFSAGEGFAPGYPAGKPETIEEIATRVLFSDSLEEKLAPFELAPGPLTNSARSADVSGCEPGRPAGLRFSRPGTARPSLPATANLVDEESRGVLLHFFANHELLAAELMALALLRFPDAPEAFRRGLLHTLREEQLHTLWYSRRLRRIGVDFGSYPVNRFFWDAVSGMEDPLDYVSRLSLTFEQANLDYSRHYAGVLRDAGDDTSAAILERIYRDEISHVGYGLRWFRKWKDPAQSDWEALEERLPFPLSPSRAKGNRAPFNAEGRRRAGLDEDYIHRLSLFERSQGRTPDVFYFNPDAENRIAALPGPYHPPKRVASIVEDLEFLVTFLARRDDVVLLRELPAPDHLVRLRDAGFVLPEFERLGPEGLAPDSLLRERKIDRFRPWSKAPDLPGLFPGLDVESRRQPMLRWSDSDDALFRKSVQAEVFREWFGPSHPIRNEADLRLALARFHREGTRELIWKPSLAAAGGGIRAVSTEELTALLEASDTPDLGRAGGFLLEPRHERVFDFSIQFEASAESVRRIGLVHQLVTASGGYRGSISMPKFCQGLDPELARFLMGDALPAYEEGSPLLEQLARWTTRHDYTGPLGIDSYVYREQGGELRHRVICEINCRHTMGRVAHEIRRRIAPGHGVRLDIQRADEAPSGKETVQLRDGRISAGTLTLTPPRAGARFAASISTGKQLQDLLPAPAD